MAIDRTLIQELRDLTGLGLMDCRKALEETGGDIEKAIESLRKKGSAVAAKRAGKETTEGLIHAYIHPGSQIGVMIELNCETDFVARTEATRQFAQDVCLHITALKPLYLSPEDVDPKFLAHEKEIIHELVAASGKPEKMLAQIVEGKIQRLYSEICLLNQTFVKNDQLTVNQALEQLIAKTGENIKIKRFARFAVGS